MEVTAKRNREALTQNGRQTELIVTELHNLKLLVQENRAGLSEEAKKARIAPGAALKEPGCQKAYAPNWERGGREAPNSDHRCQP